MAIVACHASTSSPAVSLRERTRDLVDVVGGQLLECGVELRQFHA